MSKYLHKKGVIQDNALQALLHDPLFRQRVEKNSKGKGSYRRKEKNMKGVNWEGSVKCLKQTFNTAFLICTVCHCM